MTNITDMAELRLAFVEEESISWMQPGSSSEAASIPNPCHCETLTKLAEVVSIAIPCLIYAD